jgi:hypothetical protein
MLLVPISYDQTTLLDPGDRVYLTPRRSSGTRVRRLAAKLVRAAA